jgi:hypothetical protein
VIVVRITRPSLFSEDVRMLTIGKRAVDLADPFDPLDTCSPVSRSLDRPEPRVEMARAAARARSSRG